MFLWVAVFALVSSRPLPSEKIAPLAAQVKSPFCDSCLYKLLLCFSQFQSNWETEGFRSEFNFNVITGKLVQPFCGGTALSHPQIVT